MAYKFMFSGIPDHWADANGLKFREFDFYPIEVPGSGVTPSPNPYGLSSSAWTTDIEGSVTSIDRTITSSNTTFVYRGYFKPDQTSTSWQFRTRSNDGSFFWIDNDATGSTPDLITNNAVIKNGGTHTEQTVTSANLTLSQSAAADLYYAIALVAGNKPCNGSIRLEFRRDAGDWETDGAGFYFFDSRWGDGFDPP